MSKISYSAWNKWHTCPHMYKLHYVDKIRPTTSSSALLFGSAIDDVLNDFLLKGGDPVQMFREIFTEEYFGNCDLHRDDFEEHIFTPGQLEMLKGQSDQFKAWASMRIKGRILLEKYKELALPHIIKTESTQLSLQERRGFVDAIMEIEGHGRVLIDHKTSTRPYKFQQTKDSTQLALYARELGIDKIGYIVMIKKIYKTNRYPQIQMFIDDVDKHVGEITHKSISDTEELIKTGIFPRNLSACGKIYGKPCIYHDKCWKKGNK